MYITDRLALKARPMSFRRRAFLLRHLCHLPGLFYLLSTNVNVQASPVDHPTSEDAQDILFTTDIFGRFAWPGCSPNAQGTQPNLARLATAVRLVGARSGTESNSHKKPIFVHAGSMIRFDVLGNFIFGTNDTLAEHVSASLSKIGLDAVSIGIHDFGATPDRLRRYLRLMKRAKIPVVMSNIRCEQKEDFRCRLSQRQVIVDRGNRRTAVIAVTRKDLTRRILSRSVGSLHVDDPVSSIRSRIRRLRGNRVDRIILLAELALEGGGAQPVLTFVRALGSDAPDLVVASKLYDVKGANFVLQIERGQGPRIVGTDRFGSTLGHMTLHKRPAQIAESQSDGYSHSPNNVWQQHPTVTRHAVRSFAPDAQVEARLQKLMRAMCAEFHRPLGAVAKKPVSRRHMIAYILELMRRSQGAELAALQNSGVADVGFPLRGELTREQVLRLLRTETTVGTVTVRGGQLASLIGRHAAGDSGSHTGLHVLGLGKHRGRWLVNNRPIVPTHHYRIATTAFVADKGDNLVSWDKTTSFRGGEATLRDIVLGFLVKRSIRQQGAFDISRTNPFPSLADRWLYAGSVDLGLATSLVAVDNGSSGTRYIRPLLRRDQVADVSANLHLHVSAQQSGHQFDLDAQLQYGRTWTRAQGVDETTAAESQDRIFADLEYRLQVLRDILRTPRWLTPEPFIDGVLTTEFTPEHHSSMRTTRPKRTTMRNLEASQAWDSHLIHYGSSSSGA